jgi:phenylpropionate dioxygenase-like ring-hydroxylating dioxygenase large terminal subunit
MRRDVVTDEARTLERLQAVRPDEGLIPTLVHGDAAVHRLELERIFQRTWLFVAHESEIPAPGDFVTREMGEQSVIVSRGQDAAVRVFLNVCPHRAMRLCSEDAGHKQVFRCPYHGFTFVNDGRLSGVPYRKDAYPGGFDRQRLSLSQARVDSYQGLVFATFNPDPEPLADFLGNLRWYLDIVVGRAEMEVVGVPQRFIVPTGWKVATENFIADAYHTATVHAFLAKLDLTDGVDFGRDGYHVVPQDGHGLGIGVQDDGPWVPEEVQPEVEERLDPEQRKLLARVKNFHGNAYPNLAFLIPNVLEIAGRRVSATTLRQWQPLGPDRIRVYSWLLVEKHAAEAWKDLARKAHVMTFGASGMLEQDDTEIWEAVSANTKGLLVREEPWYLDYTMGMGADPITFPGPGTVYEGKFNEASARGFYRRWLTDMTGRAGA